MSNKLKLAIGFIALVLAHFFSGCSQSKQIAKAKQRLDANPFEAAMYCADRFPVQEQIIYTPGKERIDTFYQPVSDYVPFDCPPSDTVVTYRVDVKFKEKIITRTQRDTITIIQENIARVTAMGAQLAISQDVNKELSTRLASAKKTITWLWALVVAVAIALGIWAYFRIKAGAINGILSKLKV